MEAVVQIGLPPGSTAVWNLPSMASTLNAVFGSGETGGVAAFLEIPG